METLINTQLEEFDADNRLWSHEAPLSYKQARDFLRSSMEKAYEAGQEEQLTWWTDRIPNLENQLLDEVEKVLEEAKFDIGRWGFTKNAIANIQVKIKLLRK